MDKQATIQQLRKQMQHLQSGGTGAHDYSGHRVRTAARPDDAHCRQTAHAFGSSGTAAPERSSARCARHSRSSKGASGASFEDERTVPYGATSDVCGAGDEKKTVDDAVKRIVKLASVRERSQSELYRRLSKAGFDGECAHDAICRTVAWGIVDDRRFADALARTRIAQGKGCPGIERELEENGISPSILVGWPEAYTEGRGSEFARATQLLERKPSRAKNLLQSSYRKLVVNGYSSDIAMRAARSWCAHQDVQR